MRWRSMVALLGGAVLFSGCHKGSGAKRVSDGGGSSNGGTGSGGELGGDGDDGGDGGTATIGGGFSIAFVLPLAGAEPVGPDDTVTVTVQAQTAGADLDQMTLNVDGAQFGTAVHENPGAWTLTLGGAYPFGTHQLQAFGLDLTGRAATALREFDIGPPHLMADAGSDTDGGGLVADQVSVEIISPEAGSLVGRAQKIVAAGSASSGDTLTYSFLIDHLVLPGCEAAATPICLWDTRTFAGDVLLEVTACDPAGICASASETVRVPSWGFQALTVPSDAPLLDVGAAGQLRIFGREPYGGVVPGYRFQEFDSSDGDAGLSFQRIAQSTSNAFPSSCTGCYAAQPDGAGWIAWDAVGAPFTVAPLDDGGFASAMLSGFATDAGPTTTAQLFTSAAGTATLYLGTHAGLGLGAPPETASLLSGTTGPVHGSIQLLTEPADGSSGPPAVLVQQDTCASIPCMIPNVNRVVLALRGTLHAGTLPKGSLPNAAAHWAVQDSRGVHLAVAMPDGGLQLFESPDAGGDYAATPLYGALVATETGCASPGCPVYLSLVEDQSETLHLIFPGSLDTHATTSGVALVHGYFAPGAPHWEFEWLADVAEQSVQAALYQDAPAALVWNGRSQALLFTFR